MFAIFRSVLRDEDGATMVEYGLYVVLMALVTLGDIQIAGSSTGTLFKP
jgi:Flp pilus assembly pilin Flp